MRPHSPRSFATVALVAAALLPAPPARGQEGPVTVSLVGLQKSSRVGVTHDASGQTLRLSWQNGGKDSLEDRLVLNLGPGRPLVGEIAVLRDGVRDPLPLLKDVDPVFYVTVGTRENPPDRPPGMSVFNVFFDSPAKRPYETYEAKLAPKNARVTGRDGRATVAIDGLTAGPFSGELQFTVYEGSDLIHVEAVVSTRREKTAFLYDAGLALARPSEGANSVVRQFAWFDTDGKIQTRDASPEADDRAVAVLHRAVAAVVDNGSVTCFPPPHQFFFPRDLTDNQKTVWFGRNHRGLDPRPGFGIRQTETGGGSYVPWFNAPPGTAQRLGVFYEIKTRASGENAVRSALAFTRGDRYADLPGYTTFSSHWHMATTVAAMKEIADGKGRTTPDFVKMFKDLNVRIVHLAEFHGDGHPQDPGPLRLPEMKAMFDECRRLSDDRLVFLPGEEANVHLGVSKPGQNPGHWLYLFPRPVYWTMKRGPGKSFAEDLAPFGRVYHVRDRDDMFRLLKDEHGLAWTAHPRIKASNWAPDAYRDADYYQSDHWLGAAWKAMPADLSSPRLGDRVLNLLDDMANWGPGKKYALGEVDVFKVDHTHELFAHMNVNYLRLDRAPRYEDDWAPVLDALRGGKFFVTTGEVLLTDFHVAGTPSGGTLKLPSDGRPPLSFGLDWTFPMRHAEVVSGDGTHTYRETVDLTSTPAFSHDKWTIHPDLRGRKWVRIEAWDVAANGTFSQPVWLEEGAPK